MPEKLKDIPVDSVTLAAEAEYERLLDEASRFADTVYYCNVIENFELALQYADSALTGSMHIIKKKICPPSPTIYEIGGKWDSGRTGVVGRTL